VYRIGWFSSGRDEAARKLLSTIFDAIRLGEIPAEIIFVFSNREQGESSESDRFLELGRKYDLPIVTFSSARFKPKMRADAKNDPQTMKKWRQEYDEEVANRLSPYTPDLIILAGYMLIVSKALCQKFKMVNLHPALPKGPVGTWQEVIWKLIEQKASEAGAMMHLVTEELDQGPPLTYFSFPLRGGSFDKLWEDEDKNPLFNEIRLQGVKQEMPLIFWTLKKLAEGEIKIEDTRVFKGEKLLKEGLRLNQEIEEYRKRGG